MESAMEEVSSEMAHDGEPPSVLQEDVVEGVVELQEAVVVEEVALQETIAEPVYYPEYQFDTQWTLICGTKKEFENNKSQGFLKGCKWSPDGTCLLTCADDGLLRLFDLPADLYNSHKTTFQGCSTTELSPSLRIKEGEIIYDYCWHPHMSSWNQETCLLASSSKGSPTHLWDAYKGSLAATYRAYNNVDEVEAANSLCISPDGEKLYCGFDKCVRVFDVQVPGRNCQIRLTKSTDGLSASQSGIISCIAVNAALPSVYAAASYLKTIGLYSEPEGTALCVLEGHRGGVTHLKFSPDGMVLYSGGRKDPEILCWDLRNPGQVLYTMIRTVETNQRIYFDLDPSGHYLISGTAKNFHRIGSKELVGLRHDGAASSMFNRLFHQEAGRAGLEYAYNNHAYYLAFAAAFVCFQFFFYCNFFYIFPTTGDTNGCVTIWDTQMGVETSASESPLLSMKSLPERFRCRVNDDCTNGVSFHPWLPLVATSSGQRHLTCRLDDSVHDSSGSESSDCEIDDEPSARHQSRENSVKLWWAGNYNTDHQEA